MLAVALLAAALVGTAVTVGHRSGTVAVGSNGESGKDVQQILDDSAFAFFKAASVHLTGNVTADGVSAAYDLRMSSGGAQGTLVAEGATLDIIVLGEDAYLRGRDFFGAFAGPDADDLIGDRWVHVQTDDPKLGPYLQTVSMPGLQQIISQLAVDNPLDKGGTTTVDGAQVVALTADGVELDIALNGRPYPRALRGSDGTSHFDLRFGDFDRPQPMPEKPADVFGQWQQLSV